MSKPTIIGIPQSTYVRVVRMAAAEKELDYDYDPQPPHSDPVNAIHPLGRVPVWRHGSVELCESRAICAYMDRAFAGPKLVPDDTVKAAAVEQWVSMVNTAMDRTLIREYLFSYLFPKGADGQPDRAAIDALLPEVEKQIGILATAIAANGELACDEFSLADLNVLPMLFYLSNTPEAGPIIQGHGALSDYFGRHSERASFRETVPPKPSS